MRSTKRFLATIVLTLAVGLYAPAAFAQGTAESPGVVSGSAEGTAESPGYQGTAESPGYMTTALIYLSVIV
ncbi:MAG TPA: hypothetical protein VF543_18205 [Pyrinomonadaceae bacterium]|jgi:uncharacterized membrane protein